MIATPPPNRCRLVLVAPLDGEEEAVADAVRAALSGGDVASLIIPLGGRHGDALQVLAERVVPSAQDAGVAVVIEGDSRVAGRVGADGIHLDTGRAELAEAVERHRGRLIVGAGGAKSRDDALELGETRPDYIFFGRFGYDVQPEPHPRNLKLGQWWAEMIALPCIVLGGSATSSAGIVAATGAEFVALSSAVFGADADPARAVAAANALLDETAPRFEG